MARRSKKNKKQPNHAELIKEMFLAVLACVSVGLIVIEPLLLDSTETMLLIDQFDIAVSVIFLTDLFYGMYRSQNAAAYAKKNWYVFLASIPLTSTWAQVLRGLRIIKLVRVLKAGEHLEYEVTR